MEALMAETMVAVGKLHEYLDLRKGVLESAPHVRRFESLATKLRSAASKKTTQENKVFFERNMHFFYAIHTNLAGYYIADGHKQLIPLFRGPHDKIFAGFDVKRPGAKFGNLPTKVFNEFIKGISYFATESVIESPVYHRESSCGTKELDIKAKFKRRMGYSHDAGLLNMEHVRQCYIERLIYDAIYEAVLHRQNIPHLVEKERMSRIYTDMYPGSQLRVYISHFAGTPPIFPTRLIITDGIDLYRPNYEEEYFKDGGLVRCSKLENGQMFHKFQTFEKEMPWLEGRHPTRRNIFKPLSI